MNTQRQNVSIDEIAKAFTKIYKGLEEKYVSVIEKEMRKIVPSIASEVVTMPGYVLEDACMSITFYVSNPKSTEKVKQMKLDTILFELMLKTEIDKLQRVWSCINRLEEKGNKYEIDSTEVRYNEELKDYVFVLYLFKK